METVKNKIEIVNSVYLPENRLSLTLLAETSTNVLF